MFTSTCQIVTFNGWVTSHFPQQSCSSSPVLKPIKLANLTGCMLGLGGSHGTSICWWLSSLIWKKVSITYSQPSKEALFSGLLNDKTWLLRCWGQGSYYLSLSSIPKGASEAGWGSLHIISRESLSRVRTFPELSLTDPSEIEPTLQFPEFTQSLPFVWS